jgi:hypothetical protein
MTEQFLILSHSIPSAATAPSNPSFSSTLVLMVICTDRLGGRLLEQPTGKTAITILLNVLSCKIRNVTIFRYTGLS